MLSVIQEAGPINRPNGNMQHRKLLVYFTLLRFKYFPERFVSKHSSYCEM